jgi:glycosyltransferase involved in cell wall biosynthesis
VNKVNKDCITLDLIGISGTYKGGASIFARTFLAEFVANNSTGIRVVLPERERDSYSDFEFNDRNITFHYFEPRDNIFARLVFFLGTRLFQNRHMLARVQQYRWKEVVRFIEENSNTCLSLSTYISFPLSNVRHYCTLHDIQEKALPKFFTYTERSIRRTHVLNTLHNVTGLQVSSEFVKTQIIKYYPRESARIDFRVIPEGYSELELNSANQMADSKPEPIKIIMPANYWPHKDHRTLFRALELLNEEFKLEVFCTGSMLGSEKEIASELNNYNLTNVKFTGYLSRSDLIKLYKSCHIVLSCSMYESSSLPILEGAVLGCIPIASDIPPHIEMSKRLEMRLFRLGDYLDLHRAVTDVITAIRLNRSTIQILNSEKVQELSWNALLPQYLDFMSSKFIN